MTNNIRMTPRELNYKFATNQLSLDASSIKNYPCTLPYMSGIIPSTETSFALHPPLTIHGNQTINSSVKSIYMSYK